MTHRDMYEIIMEECKDMDLSDREANLYTVQNVDARWKNELSKENSPFNAPVAILEKFGECKFFRDDKLFVLEETVDDFWVLDIYNIYGLDDGPIDGGEFEGSAQEAFDHMIIRG